MRTLGPWALMGQAHLQPPWPHDLPKPVLDSTPPLPKAVSTTLARAGPPETQLGRLAGRRVSQGHGSQSRPGALPEVAALGAELGV